MDFEFLRPEVNAAFSYEQMAAGHPSTSADVKFLVIQAKSPTNGPAAGRIWNSRTMSENMR